MMKILIVDDNEVLANLIKEMLDREGLYQVETAVNGEEGYEAFFNFKPDIILTDIEMPVKNGIEMIRDIRAHHPGVKTIYMSSNIRRYQALLEHEKTEYKSELLNKPLHYPEIKRLFQECREERM